uniref:hypothetical protein n=1 Tax=Ramlibacter sp. 2FC TaxID=2502188 RepID=UPI00148592E7
VRQATRQVVRRPQAVQRLARPLVPRASRATPRGQAARVVARTVAPVARRAAPAAVRGATSCPNCRTRSFTMQGPVTITIRGR